VDKRIPLSEKVIKQGSVKIMGKVVLPRPSFSSLSGASGNNPLLRKERARSPSSGEEGIWKVKIAEARKEGYERGFAEGRESLKGSVQKLTEALMKVTRELDVLKRRLFDEAEKEMLKLVIATAEKVIRREVATDRSVILDVLREATRALIDRENVKIRLNPQDLTFLNEVKPEFPKEIKELKNVTFHADDSIEPGGAVLETTMGEVDARLEQQLEEIKKTFKLDA